MGKSGNSRMGDPGSVPLSFEVKWMSDYTEMEANPGFCDSVFGLSGAEYSVLKALWTKQISIYPDFSIRFAFRVASIAGEYSEYCHAGDTLVFKGLVRQDNGFYSLTNAGFEYCVRHYRELSGYQSLMN